jgi:hypothetical protein
MWWCPKCKKEAPPNMVTFDETHDTCGYLVLDHDPDSDLTAALRERDEARGQLCRARNFIQLLLPEVWGNDETVQALRARKAILGLLFGPEDEKWPPALLQKVHLHMAENEDRRNKVLEKGNVPAISGEPFRRMPTAGEGKSQGEDTQKDSGKRIGPEDIEECGCLGASEEAKELSRMRNERDSSRTPRGLRRSINRNLALLKVSWDEAQDSVLATLSSSSPCPHAERLKALEEAGEGAARIVSERIRQKQVEGWTPEHDARHDQGELAIAAACYALNKMPAFRDPWQAKMLEWWPWHPDWDKRNKHDRERSLEIAGALIAAELDRLAELRRRVGEG